MANKLYDETAIQDIADALREKNGSTDTYKVAEMGDAVREISTGTLSGFFEKSMNGEANVVLNDDRLTEIVPWIGLTFFNDNLEGIICRNADIKTFITTRDGVVDHQMFENRYMKYFLAPNNTLDILAYALSYRHRDYSSRPGYYSNRNMVKCDVGFAPSIATYCFRHNEACKAYIFRKTEGVVTVNGALSNNFGYSPLVNNDASLGHFIYVPRALVETYKADTNWSIFSNCFRAIEDYPEICDMDDPNWTPTRV